VDKPRSPISITICAFNAVEYTKLLVESIRRNSRYDHEIVIYSDGSRDGTLDWLKKEAGIVWQHDRTNRGICTAMNRAARMTTREYLFFPNTDHVLAPGWDEALIPRLAPRTVVSCQCIEPGIVPVARIFHAVDCGTRWDEFNEGRFQEAAKRLARKEETPGINYPFVLSKELWDEVGGLDERFDPGPANDPDLFYRLSFLGVRMVRAEDAIIYHFSGKSSRMADEATAERMEWHAVTDRNEGRFVEKWGERYRYSNGGLPDPGPEAVRRWEDLRPSRPAIEVRTPLQVAVDMRSLGPKEDGIGIYTRSLIRALSKLNDGPVVHCLVPSSAREEERLGGIEKVILHECDIPPTHLEREAAEMPSFLANVNADVFHGPAFSLPAASTIASVVTVHDLAFLLFPEWYPADFIRHLTAVLERSLRSASRVIVVSDSTGKDFCTRYPEWAGKVTRIYEAPPEGPASPIDQESKESVKARWTRGAEFILSVGVQQRRKNAVGLVRAFSRVKRESRISAKLLLVGGMECEDPRLRDEIREQALEEEVLLTPHLSRSDLDSLYAAASVFVYPSHFEGFGLPPLEAMSWGLPVISSSGGSLAEVVGEGGRLFPPEDLESLTLALKEVLLDQATRDDLVRRGKARVQEFSWERAARETVTAYRAAIDMKRNGGGASHPPEDGRALPTGRGAGELRSHSPVPRIAVDARLFGQDRMGTGRYTSEIVRSLLTSDHRAEWVLIGPKRLEGTALSKNSTILQHFPEGQESLLDPAWEQYSLPAHLSGCDLYYAPTGITPVARPCKAVPVIHDLGYLDHPDHYDSILRRHLERWIRNSCLAGDRLISVSEFTRDRLVEHYGIPRERISVVHHGRPEEGPLAQPRTPPEEALDQTPTEAYVLCVSSFEPNKNIGLLVQAFRELSQGWPGKLVLAGRKGRDLERIEALVRESNLGARVSLVLDPGDVRLASLYHGASLFAYPSLYEGFGLPLIEAMSVGLPVIANKIASCGEVVGNGGLVLKDPSPGEWAEGMQKVLSSTTLQEELSHAALARSRSFSWSKAGHETWAAIEECLRER
jgi:glycosyltransferase involved in cell wall biosynthesis/GT2 family glycosyltransferase